MIEVLKWIVLILLAGFIGQFGKSLSIQTIDYFKRRKHNLSSRNAKGAGPLPTGPAEGSPNANKKFLKAQAKVRKKALKA